MWTLFPLPGMPVIITLGLVQRPSRTQTAGCALNAWVVSVLCPMYSPTGCSDPACRKGYAPAALPVSARTTSVRGREAARPAKGCGQPLRGATA